MGHSEEKNKKSSGLNYVLSALGSLLLTIPLTYWLMPDLIPFTFLEVWDDHGTGFVDWMLVGWPVFLWGVSVSMFMTIVRNKPVMTTDGRMVKPENIFIIGTLISLWAGITEEVAFRWLSYYGVFLGIWLTNFLFFGYFGFGIPEWFHLSIWGPLANWTTFGYLESYIFHETTWIAGGAMLAVNALFRDGHKYQGPVGWINSWFLGMYFFWVMFNYGLFAAIVIHVFYDFFIFSALALYVLFTQDRPLRSSRPRRGWRSLGDD